MRPVHVLAICIPLPLFALPVSANCIFPGPIDSTINWLVSANDYAVVTQSRSGDTVSHFFGPDEDTCYDTGFFPWFAMMDGHAVHTNRSGVFFRDLSGKEVFELGHPFAYPIAWIEGEIIMDEKERVIAYSTGSRRVLFEVPSPQEGEWYDDSFTRTITKTENGYVLFRLVISDDYQSFWNTVMHLDQNGEIMTEVTLNGCVLLEGQWSSYLTPSRWQRYYGANDTHALVSWQKYGGSEHRRLCLAELNYG